MEYRNLKSIVLMILLIINIIISLLLVVIGMRYPIITHSFELIPSNGSVTLRGAMVDGKWLNPSDFINENGGWKFTEDLCICNQDDSSVIFEIEGRQIDLVFNTGQEEGIIDLLVDNNLITYNLSDYKSVDVGTRFSVVGYGGKRLTKSFFKWLPFVLLVNIVIMFILFTLLIGGVSIINKGSQQNKNGTIEALRLFLCFSILFHHTTGYAPAGYLGVDAFFMISGYFLMNHYRRDCQQKYGSCSAWKYILFRWKRIVPEYFCSFVCSVLLFITIGRNYSLTSILTDWIWELLMVKNIGIAGWTENLMIGPGWFCSALLLASFFAYILLVKNEHLYIQVIVPCSILLLFPYLANEFGNLNRWTQCDLFTPTGNLRAFVELGLGCVIYYFVNDIIPKYTFRKNMRLLIGLIEIGCIVFAIIKIWKVGESLSDFSFVILMAVFLIIAFSEFDIFKNIFKNRIIFFGGNISMCIYLNHIVLSYINWTELFKDISYIVYLGMVILLSALEYMFIRTLQNKWKEDKIVIERG